VFLLSPNKVRPVFENVTSEMDEWKRCLTHLALSIVTHSKTFAVICTSACTCTAPEAACADVLSPGVTDECTILFIKIELNVFEIK
jgi:hypothetical protein